MHTPIIGIIDSGVGGLSVYQAIKAKLPTLTTVYVADSLHIPYGAKSAEFITTRSIQLVTFLEAKGVSIIVIACNTITVTCLTLLREQFPNITFIGTVPSIKQAALLSQTHEFAVLATTHTAKSSYVHTLITEFAPFEHVLLLGTDELVPLIEKGEIEGERITRVLEKTLAPMRESSCDVLVLGCTHFPFLRPVLSTILGESVTLLDSGDAVAERVAQVMKTHEPHGASDRRDIFITTGSLQPFNAVVTRLLALDLKEESFLQAQI